MSEAPPLPPPLPTPALVPAKTAESAASRLVTTTAKMSLVLGALAVLWCLVQLVLSVMLSQSSFPEAIARSTVEVPRSFVYLVKYANLISTVCLAMSLLFFLAAWGLLKRRTWGYVGFIVFLIVIAIANFAGLPVIDAFYSDMTTILPSEFYQQEEGQRFLQQINSGRLTSLIFGTLAALGIAALHGWLVFKLVKPDVRALFR